MKTTLNKNRKMNIRKFLIAIMVAILPMTTFAQSTFDEFEDLDEVTTVVVNEKMFNMMSKVDVDTQEGKEYISMVKSLKSLRVFATESVTIAAKMKTKVDSYLKSSNLSELMRVKDKDANVKIYVREGKDEDHVKELFMFVNGIGKHMKGENRKAEAVIVSITGDIDLNRISELTRQMNIQGGEHLKKAKKKN